METEIRHSERALKIVQDYILLNDDFMKIVFADKECTQLMLRIILEKPDLEVLEVETEYTMNNLHGRGVRLDVYAKDSAGIEYDIEIQRNDKGAGSKRARYNSSMLDVNIAEPGDDLEHLKETYVIFITEKDVIKKGLPIYHIDRMIRETKEIFDDKAHILYVNSEITDETALGKLMHDFRCKRADQMKYEVLSKKVSSLKETDEGVDSMCRAVEEYGMELKEEGRAEGMAEGRAEGRAEGMAEGRAEGRAEGMAEGIAKGTAKGRADIIARLKAYGMSKEQIDQILSAEV